MVQNGNNPGPQKQSLPRSHEEFLELCAVATSGELSKEEQKRLHDHLATCAECRQALQEFEAVAAIGVPFLSSDLSTSSSSEPHGSPDHAELESSSKNQGKGLPFSHRDGRSQAQVSWGYVWMSLAAAVVLVATLGIYSYQFGKQKGQEVTPAAASTPDPRVEALEQQMSDAGHEKETLKAQLAQRDGMIAELRRQIADQSSVLAELKNTQSNLEHSLQNDRAEKQQLAQDQSNERSKLLEKLDAAQASLLKTQSEFDSLGRQRLQDRARVEGLEAQIGDLHGQLRDREQTLDKQEELLAHDRDIRDLMGARDLYIAEVYDVALDGSTKKPYGRVFYTKGKSLIFYAYDLDSQPGMKNASTFQAWGRGGPDRQQVLSLGIFYQDSAAKKRWVLKFDDPRMLEQLDAVFVTVEPPGGSHKPSTRPLLFASLRIPANHP